jgi:hypothetical protein
MGNLIFIFGMREVKKEREVKRKGWPKESERELKIGKEGRGGL